MKSDHMTSHVTSYIMFYFCFCCAESVEGVVRLTEARLRRDILERRVIDFLPTENGFEVIKTEALSVPEGKV